MNTLLTLTRAGSAVALLLILAGRLLGKKLPATLYYYLWIVALLRFALPLPGLVPQQTEREAAAPKQVYTAVQTPSPRQEIPAFTAETAQAPRAEKTPVSSNIAVNETAETAARAAEPSRRASAETVILWVWAAGTCISLALRLTAYLRLRRWIKRTLCAPSESVLSLYKSISGSKPPLYVSAALGTPLTYGLIRPIIVLPQVKFKKTELEYALRHELVHVRRRDTLYKLIALCVLSAHWFNPLSYIALNEIERACELSCDEALIRRMNPAQKRAYGHALLNMASAALPNSAYSPFTASKKVLKRRLEQIMSYKKNRVACIAAVLLPLILLVGIAAGPAVIADGNGESTASALRVSTVDELLAAIRPNAVIELTPGDYDLSVASDYAKDSANEYYSWYPLYSRDESTFEDVLIGAELRIKGVSGLKITGADRENTRILAVPRFANVLSFTGCSDLTLSGLTLGHTVEPGYCSGGVVWLEACNGTVIEDCGLFGCGTVGVRANDCVGLTVNASHIYECSEAAVEANSCRDVLVSNCDIYEIGTGKGKTYTEAQLESGIMESYALFGGYHTDGFEISDSRIHNNSASRLLSLTDTVNARFLANEISDNLFYYVFSANDPITVDGCSFTNFLPPYTSNTDSAFEWIDAAAGTQLFDASGELLDGAMLEAMQLKELSPGQAANPVQSDSAAEVPKGAQIGVSDMVGLLNALGPERTILLEDGVYDIGKILVPTASLMPNDAYRIEDGRLIIQDISGLTLRSASGNADSAVITSIEMTGYSTDADIFKFENCSEVSFIELTLSGLGGTALSFDGCFDITLDGCTVKDSAAGIRFENSASFKARNTELCGFIGLAFESVYADGPTFINCRVHDTASPALRFEATGDKMWNGEAFTDEGYYDVDEDGKLQHVRVDRRMNAGYERNVFDGRRFINILYDGDVNAFAAINGEMWGTPYANSAFAGDHGEEGDVSAMPDGNISVRSHRIYQLVEEDSLFFTATFVYAEEGLYACNTRATFENQTDAEIRVILNHLVSALSEELGTTDANGVTVVSDFTNVDVHSMGTQYVWLGADGTFLRLHAGSFMNSVYVDVSTGLIAYFPNYIAEM